MLSKAATRSIIKRLQAAESYVGRPDLMAGDQVSGQRAIIRQDVHDLSISKLVTGHYVFPIDLCANHVVANICVDMIGKV